MLTLIMSSLNIAYLELSTRTHIINMSILFLITIFSCPKSVGLFCFVFLNTGLFISFTQHWEFLTAHDLLSEEMVFFLNYIMYGPMNSKNPIKKSDLLETFHGGHVLNLGYFLFAQQTTGISRVKLNETMEISQVSQPLIGYMHQYMLNVKSTVHSLFFLTQQLHLCCRMQYCKCN